MLKAGSTWVSLKSSLSQGHSRIPHLLVSVKSNWFRHPPWFTFLSGSAMDAATSTSYDELSRVLKRLQQISPHDALVLLKNCLGGTKLQHVLMTSSCCEYPQLLELDYLLRSSVTQICNVSLSDDEWTQASLPVRCDGLRVRSVSKLVFPDLFASSAVTLSSSAGSTVCNIRQRALWN
jgi:hypothetical protein